MGLKAGIVGLPNVGKSTLFNAITKQNILAANYPFATIEPNVGVVLVPDSRIDYLVKLYNPKSIVPTTFEFTDIAGLVKGASQGEGLGNKFLSHIREVDAIVEVIRCFDDEFITHVAGLTDPLRDMDIINVELILADLEIVQNRIGKIEKKAETTKEKSAIFELNVLRKIEMNLLNNKALRLVEFDKEELIFIKNFNFLTLKPIIYVTNVDEETIVVGDNDYTLKVKEQAEKENAGVIVMCAKLEEDLAGLEDEERLNFLESCGITNSGLDKLIFATYDLLGLATFFTSGTDEVRAWTFKKGSKAPVCAGIIHKDFERGFIRVEVTRFTDLEKYGTELKVKEAGKLQIEGKEYIIQDGDICYFRFNV
ncbi:MAG: redox-regulated ATPase YchF [Bacilli bacterium]